MSVRDNPVLPNPEAKITHFRVILYPPASSMIFEHCTNLTHNSNRRGMSFLTQMGITIHTSLPFLAEEEE
jgi:hypothetical protein